jgi:hypothetical protein
MSLAIWAQRESRNEQAFSVISFIGNSPTIEQGRQPLVRFMRFSEAVLKK